MRGSTVFIIPDYFNYLINANAVMSWWCNGGHWDSVFTLVKAPELLISCTVHWNDNNLLWSIDLVRISKAATVDESQSETKFGIIDEILVEPTVLAVNLTGISASPCAFSFKHTSGFRIWLRLNQEVSGFKDVVGMHSVHGGLDYSDPVKEGLRWMKFYITLTV